MSDKDKNYIDNIKSLISRMTSNKTSYRKPLLEMPNITDVSALITLLTREEYGILMIDIVHNKIDNRKPLEERFYIELTPENLGLGRNSFFKKIKKFKQLNIIEKAKGPRMYLFNPAFAHTGLTMYEKYQLGFMSEKEYIAKMKFSERVKQMSGK